MLQVSSVRLCVSVVKPLILAGANKNLHHRDTESQRRNATEDEPILLLKHEILFSQVLEKRTRDAKTLHPESHVPRLGES